MREQGESTLLEQEPEQKQKSERPTAKREKEEFALLREESETQKQMNNLDERIRDLREELAEEMSEEKAREVNKLRDERAELDAKLEGLRKKMKESRAA